MSVNTPTTELEAVNIILSGIGETPVNTLIGELTTDVSQAKALLTEISREVQAEGWVWNTEREYPLKTNQNNEIVLPANVLLVYFREPDTRLYTVRGTRVYNLSEHTFKFDKGTAIKALSIILFLDFDELPETARRYITLKALRVFQERTVGSLQLSQYQREDELKARASLLSDNFKIGRHSMLQGTTGPNNMGYNSFLPILR